ncbi:MAG: hypothetical protein K2H90_00050 [Oscillospiraceae bacterium]|nr:hypothetical protein [Oscillospiraceae bacterium]
MNIKGLDHLAQDIVEFYSAGIDSITESTFAAAKECAESCCEKIKAASPRGTGKYRQGWVVRKTSNGYMVYNKTEPHLEMILEHGHVISKGERKGERIEGVPHIYDNADEARDKFYSMCVDIKSSGVRLKFKRR